MEATNTTIRRVAYTAGVVLTVLAALATGAAGAQVGNVVEPSEQRALSIRGKALNCKHVRAQDCMTDAEFRALMIRSEALNRKYGLGTAN